MNAVIEHCLLRQGGKSFIKTYAFTDGDDENLRDANHAIEVVDSLVCDGILNERPDYEKVVPLWRTTVEITKTRHNTAVYKVDYQRLHFEYFIPSVIELGREVYKEVNKLFSDAVAFVRENGVRNG